ncbi:MAG: rubredoxin [Methanocaldococcus sp.]|jgi:rubredoxin
MVELKIACKLDGTCEKPKYRKYRCKVCGWVYDPLKGDPSQNIPPKTPFEELPDDWVCPVCRGKVGKESFEPLDEWVVFDE